MDVDNSLRALYQVNPNPNPNPNPYSNHNPNPQLESAQKSESIFVLKKLKEMRFIILCELAKNLWTDSFAVEANGEIGNSGFHYIEIVLLEMSKIVSQTDTII